jgi:hypothetical protein
MQQQGYVTGRLDKKAIANTEAMAKAAQTENQNTYKSQRQGTISDKFAQTVGNYIDKDPQMLKFSAQKAQLDTDRHTLESSNGKIPVSVLNEISSGLANAISGGKAAGLGMAQRQDLENRNTRLTEILQKFGKGVQFVTDPELIDFLHTTIGRISDAVDNNSYHRARQIHQGRSAGLKNSPDALDVLNAKVESYKPMNYEEPSSAQKKSNKPASIVQGGHTYILNEQTGEYE